METIGALSVGDVQLYKKTYQPLLLRSLIVPSPDQYLRNENETPADFAMRQFEEVDRLFQQKAHEICAIIVEPLVQCAGNMRMYDPYYLKLLRDACNKYQVHLIADEIAVGFGRTGTMFACEQAQITPDFMCLSKGLTGGYLPLSVVMTNDAVYQAFYDDYVNLTAFLHSHSYTGNPLGCGLRELAAWALPSFDVITKNRHLIKTMDSALQIFRDHPHIGDIRQRGMIAALEMVQDKKNKTPYPWQERRGIRVYQYAISKGVLLRPLGNVIYFMPPYVINEQQIQYMIDVARRGIDMATID